VRGDNGGCLKFSARLLDLFTEARRGEGGLLFNVRDSRWLLVEVMIGGIWEEGETPRSE
jgi:hypothetical protein